MIHYSKDRLWTIFYWWGGINRQILPKALVYLVVVVGVYIFQLHYNMEFYTRSDSFTNTLKGILSFLVFLLVFRLNQCMARYYAAYALITDLFNGLERLIVDFCLGLHGDGGESFGSEAGAATHVLNNLHAGHGHGNTRPPPEKPELTVPEQEELSPWENSCMAIAAKVNCIRLTLAYAISILLHFQLLDGASDCAGELGETEVKQVVFFYCRLRSLLYEEEMQLIDASLSVFCDQSPGLDAVFRTEVNRYRVLGDDDRSQQLLGYPESERPSGGVTISPAPKVIMTILLQALQRPSDQPWGFQSRLWNLYWRNTVEIMSQTQHLESIIMSPTPLPYLQHCRVLFLIFAIAFPMSMDTSKGLIDNVLLPLVIFWAIIGFEILSGLLENPMGSDETDMNLYEKIQSLEVNSELVFNATECHRASLHHALLRTEDLVLGTQPDKTAQRDFVHSHKSDTRRAFRSYFRWVPLPTLILVDILDSHGEVESLHSLWLSCEYWCSKLSLQERLRKTLCRRRRGQMYEAVAKDDARKEEIPDPIVDWNKDPHFFCHFLEFVGAADVAPPLTEDGCAPQRPPGRAWRDRVIEVLGEHPAQRLLKPHADEGDSERSMMMQTPQSTPRSTSGLLAFVTGWESLS